jgi:hypothetical protein
MMNRNSIAPLRLMILVFVLLNGFFVAGRSMLEKWQVDQSVIIAGNLILFIVSVVSFLLTRKSLSSSNPHSFVRAMYGSFMIKFFVCAAAAFIYIMSAKKNVNKPALFASMGFYIVYTFMEVSSLLKLLKLKKNV